MTAKEAERYVLREWLKLPSEERTGGAAAAFAMKYAYQLEFRCKGDKYQFLNGTLQRYLGETPGKM